MERKKQTQNYGGRLQHSSSSKINTLNIIYVYRVMHTIAEYIVLSYAHRTFVKVDQMLKYKASYNTLQDLYHIA